MLENTVVIKRPRISPTGVRGLVITLPRFWIDDNGLKEGDNIFLHLGNATMAVTPTQTLVDNFIAYGPRKLCIQNGYTVAKVHLPARFVKLNNWELQTILDLRQAPGSPNLYIVKH